jgi:hypothetical protein
MSKRKMGKSSHLPKEKKAGSERTGRSVFTNKPIAKKQDFFECDEFPVPHSNSKIVEHQRALRRLHLVSQLTEKNFGEILKFRDDYKISFQWKEGLRKKYEKEALNDVKQEYYDWPVRPSPAPYDITLYKKIRGKIRSDDDPIDIKDILLLQGIVIEYYLKNRINDKGTNVIHPTLKEEFIPKLSRFGKRNRIKAIFSLVFNTESIFFQEEGTYQSFNMMGYYDVYRDGKVIEERYAMFKPTRKITDGIYLPFESLRGLERREFIDICGRIFDERQGSFKTWKGMSAEQIVYNINAYLLRTIDGLKSKEIANIEGHYSPDYAFDTKINTGISRLKKIIHLPEIEDRSR